MNIPLSNRLKMRSQYDVALLEDVLVRVIYGIDRTAEIHGGTAIWRCFGGRRFSKDIDIYLKSKDELEELKAKLPDTVERYGAKVLKFKDTGHLIYASLLMGDIHSEIDINYNKYYDNPEIKNYENLDGTFYEVLIPSPEALVVEKINAYNDRRFITDLYDMRILIDNVQIEKVKDSMRDFLSSIKSPEKEEEKRLTGLIYEGPIPTFKSLVSYIGKAIA